MELQGSYKIIYFNDVELALQQAHERNMSANVEKVASNTEFKDVFVISTTTETLNVSGIISTDNEAQLKSFFRNKTIITVTEQGEEDGSTDTSLMLIKTLNLVYRDLNFANYQMQLVETINLNPVEDE